ncbi:MAG: VCBS repeat-containing protein [Herpetosiphonaceae bacterium]|nr:VCBS repeat-containing protein [Herpetosiphonaceae bacterium]
MKILSADSTGCVWAFESNGALVPGFPWKTGGVCDNAPRINSPLAVGDIDGDGKLEIVAGTRGSGINAGQRGKVYVWRRGGTLVAGWPKEMDWAYITNGNFPEVYSVGIANIVGDSKLEVVALTSNEAGSNTNYAPNVYAWNTSGTIVPGFPTSSPKGSGIWGHVGLGDINKDGYADIITGRDEIYYYAYNGQGNIYPGWPLHTYIDTTKNTWNVDKYLEFTRSGPAIADLNGDGTVEIITAGKVRDPLLGASHPQSNSGLIVSTPAGVRRPGWETAKLGGPPLATTFTPNHPSAIADLNRDGKLDIVVTYDDGTIRAYGENGTAFWTYNYAQGRKLLASEVAIGDVTGDGQVDIIFGTYSIDSSAHPYVGLFGLNASGQPLSGFPLSLPDETTTASRGIMAGPTIADIDGDCKVEIMAHSRGGVMYAWDTNGLNIRTRLPWPTSRYNTARTGTPDPPVKNPTLPTFTVKSQIFMPVVRLGCQ